MSETLDTVYLNGNFLPIAQAKISPLDRGFLFGDAAYEVIPVFSGKPLLVDAHLKRLARSLGELRILNPNSETQWKTMITELIERNGAGDLALYIQVSRGADNGRNHVFPDDVESTVFSMVTKLAGNDLASGITAITLPDNRWGRCDIKSTALLANVLARQKAYEADADDAILIWNGEVTEAAVSSVIIIEKGTLVRRPNGREILPGTTTDHVVALAAEAGLNCQEEVISESRLRSAEEIWLTNATKGIAPVVQLDDELIGNGVPGPVWRQLITLYENYKRD